MSSDSHVRVYLCKAANVLLNKCFSLLLVFFREKNLQSGISDIAKDNTEKLTEFQIQLIVPCCKKTCVCDKRTIKVQISLRTKVQISLRICIVGHCQHSAMAILAVFKSSRV